MKLITEFSYPEDNKLISEYNSHPWVSAGDVVRHTRTFYDRVLKHFDREGFRMSVRVVEQE